MTYTTSLPTANATESEETPRHRGPQFFAGLDLGQANDPAALALIERKEGEHPPEAQRRLTTSDVPPCVYEATYMERFPLGTDYTLIAPYVIDFLRQEKLVGKVELILDAGGVGRAFTDIMRNLGLDHFVPASATNGANVNFNNRMLYLPKRELVGTSQIILQARRFRFTQESKEAQTLIHEMKSYRVKITDAANDTYAAGREKDHDDLLFALMLAIWRAEWHEKQPIVKKKQAHSYTY